jgi:ribonuclease VapC
LNARSAGRPLLLVETSALVAILLEEPGWQQLTETMLTADCQTTSVNIFEAVLALSKQTAATPTQAEQDVVNTATKLSVVVIPYIPEMLPHAVSARERYGRGRNALNMGDCLSYGAAKHLGVNLLFKGNDFAATDVNG